MTNSFLNLWFLSLESKSGTIVIVIEKITTKYTNISDEIEYISARENNNPMILVKPLHFLEECVNERFWCATYHRNIANIKYKNPDINESLSIISVNESPSKLG